MSRHILLLCCYVVIYILPGNRVYGQLTTNNADNTPATISYVVDTAFIMQQIRLGQSLRNRMPDSSVAILEAAIERSKELHYYDGTVEGLLQLGNTYTKRGQGNKARATYSAIFAYYRNNKKWLITISNVYNGIASSYEVEEDFVTAIKYYNKAIQIAEMTDSGYLLMPRLYSNVAAVLISIKQSKKSMFYLVKAQELALKNKQYNLLAAISLNIGIAYSQNKMHDKAEQFFLAARHYALDNNQLDHYHNATAALGKLYVLQNNAQKGIVYLKEVERISKEADYANQNSAARYLGVAYMQLKDYRKAEQYTLAALRYAEKGMLQRQMLDTYGVLGKLYAAMGDYKKAYTYYAEYLKLHVILMKKERIDAANQLEIKYRTAQKDKEIATDKLHIALQAKTVERKNVIITLIASGGLVLITLLIGLYRNYNHKQKLQAKQLLILQQGQEIGQLKAMMEGEEKERSRLARELHDGIGGMLASIKLNLGSFREEHTELTENKRLAEILSMLNDTSSEVRKTAHNLMPDTLMRSSLLEVLAVYCEHIRTSNMLDIDLQYNSNLLALDKATELMLYRTLQELVQNIIKHAKATKAVIQFWEEDGQLSIIIEDDGVGFDVNRSAGGYGLQNLEYRVKALQGNLDIMSAVGHGTTVTIQFDIEKLISSSVIAKK